jgi:hypothetical protein
MLMTKSRQEQFNSLELEIMRRCLEKESPERIQKHLGITDLEYVALTQTPLWQTEYEFQSRRLDRQPRSRMQRLANEALDVVVDVMRTSPAPAYQLKAALEILDRTGHGKIETRINVNADAEAIIKHLNQLGTKPPKDIPDEDSIENALIIETQSIEAAAEEVRRQFEEEAED